MAAEDYYQILGVERTAAPEEIRKAYHRLAVQYHPDKNPGNHAAEEHFKSVSEAYQVLCDPEKRAQYDRFGRAGVRGGATGGAAGVDPLEIFREFARAYSGWGDFGDLFSSFMGGDFVGRRGGARDRRGEDLRLVLPLTLEEISRSVEKTVRLRRRVRCGECGGSGAPPGGHTLSCSQCDGTGEIKVVQRVLWGQVIRTEPCRRCKGEGVLIEDPCPRCRGEGRVEAEEELALRIPAGVGDGERLAKRGAGNEGWRGGSPGDLILEIREKPHPLFERRGADLLCALPVSVAQAALGTRVSIPTLDGSVELKIPAGIQSGKMLRLRDRGISLGGRRGDLYVRVLVWTPQKLSAKEKTLLQELGRMPGMQPPKPGKGAAESFDDAAGD
jgi:molecular chaperone DnaJ